MRDDMTTLHFNEEHDDCIGVHPKSYSLIPSLYPWNYNRWLYPRNLIPEHPNINHDATPEILDKPMQDCGHGAMHCAVFYGSTVLPRVKAEELHQSLKELPRDCPRCIAKGTSFKSSTCSARKKKASNVISNHFWLFFSIPNICADLSPLQRWCLCLASALSEFGWSLAVPNSSGVVLQTLGNQGKWELMDKMAMWISSTEEESAELKV